MIIKILGEEVNMQNIREVAKKSYEMSVGDPYEMVVRRNGEEVTIKGVLLQRKTRHIFEEVENPTEEQIHFREIWMKNLDRS